MRANNNRYLGKQVGSYHIVDCLGSGGFADVYLGEHVYLKTRSAIKMLHIQLSKRAIQNFLNEAKIIARLEHPNIIRVFDYGVQDGSPFLVMNYAPNGTLRQRHPRGTSLPLEQISQYVQQVALALDYAHQLQLIHRDVKPANMLVGQQQQILLSDFGLALAVSDSDSQSEVSTTDPSSSSSSQSDISVVDSSSGSRPEISTAGTIRYMAPEQIQGKACYASDQYALGIIAYEWICGECPFTGSFMKIASEHVLAPPPSLNARIPNLPSGVEQVIFKALAKEQTQRFASVTDFAQALQQVCQTVAPLNISTQKNASAPLNGETLALNNDDTDKKNRQIVGTEQDKSNKSSENSISLDLHTLYDGARSVAPSMPPFQASHFPSDTDASYNTLKLPPEADITYNTSKISSFSNIIPVIPYDSKFSLVADMETDVHKNYKLPSFPNKASNIQEDASSLSTSDTEDRSIHPPEVVVPISSSRNRKRIIAFVLGSIALIVLLISSLALGAIWYSNTHAYQAKEALQQKSMLQHKNTQQANRSTQHVLPVGTTATATATINSGNTSVTSTVATRNTTNPPPPVSSTQAATPQPIIVLTPTPIPDCIQGSLSYIRFASRPNPVIPRSRALVLTNCGGNGSQNWQASVQSDTGWLSLNLNSGSLNPGSSIGIQVLTDATNLTANTYNGSIVFTAGSASFTVTVVYIVV